MKTGNTLINKAKFFVMYWDQKVMKWLNGDNEVVDKLALVLLEKKRNYNEYELHQWFLELKPLSLILHKDKVKLDAEFGNDFDENGYRFGQTKFHNWIPKEVDYLRSKGYALPWLDLSVKDLIEYGWIKLQGVNFSKLEENTFFNMSAEYLDLPNRVKGNLLRAEIYTLKELVTLLESDLGKFRGFGIKNRLDIHEFFEREKLSFVMSVLDIENHPKSKEILI